MTLKRLKDTRVDNDLSQKYVSSEIGVPRTTYSTWENGYSKPPLLYLIKICFVLNISLDYALNLTNDYKRKFNVKDLDLLIISNNLINLLKHENINQKQLGLDINLSESRISHIINKKEIITVKSVYLLAKKHNFSIDEFCYKIIDFKKGQDG